MKDFVSFGIVSSDSLVSLGGTRAGPICWAPGPTLDTSVGTEGNESPPRHCAALQVLEFSPNHKKRCPCKSLTSLQRAVHVTSDGCESSAPDSAGWERTQAAGLGTAAVLTALCAGFGGQDPRQTWLVPSESQTLHVTWEGRFKRCVTRSQAPKARPGDTGPRHAPAPFPTASALPQGSGGHVGSGSDAGGRPSP